MDVRDFENPASAESSAPSPDPQFDEVVLRLFESADPLAEAEALQRRASDGESLRAAVEAFGELGWSAGVAEVPAGAEQDLLSRIARQSPVVPASVLAFDRPAGRVSELQGMPDLSGVSPAVYAPANATPNWSTWAAAAGILLTLTMAALSGFFFSELRQQRSTVASLQEQLAQQSSTTTGDAVLTQRVSQMQAGYEMVSLPGTKVCRLAAKDPNQPEAAAAVFMHPNEGRWVINARNLGKCPEGRAYQVWFMTDQGPVRGGQFQIDDPEALQLATGELPEGTSGVMVTLEFPDQVGEEPSGDTVLFGDEAQELL